MNHHYFICYETSDGIDFVKRLCDALSTHDDLPRPWLDIRDLPKSENSRELIDQAIKTSDGLIFVMTPACAERFSVSRVQWQRALVNLKPIAPIRFNASVELPFRLEPREPIEFGASFDLGLQYLIEKLRWFQTEDGIRETIEFAILDAKSELRSPSADTGALEARIKYLQSLRDSLHAKVELDPRAIDTHSKQIFISYSRKDTKIMQKLKLILIKRGLKIWNDEEIEQGTDFWESSIQSAIEQAGCVISILSPDAKQSEWVRRELGYAEIRNVRVFPILIRGDETNAIPIRLISAQRANINIDLELEPQLDGLLSDLHKHIKSVSKEE